MNVILYNLRKEMMRSKITQKDISEILGITKKSVNEKINGHTEFTLKEIQLIHESYFKGLTLDYLFERG